MKGVSLKNLFRAVVAVAIYFALNETGEYIYMQQAEKFPTIEEYMGKKGFDPCLAQNISDGCIRIRDRATPPGALHREFDFIYLGTGFSFTEQFNNVLSATGNHSKNLHFIDIPDTIMTAGGFLSWKYGLPSNLVEFEPLSRKKSLLHGLLHEITHHQPEQVLMGRLMQETDSDIQANIALFDEGVLTKEDLHHLMLYRAIDLGANYDMALYLDAHIRGAPLPTEKEMLSAAYELGLSQGVMQSNDPPLQERSWITGLNSGGAEYLGNIYEGFYRLLNSNACEELPPSSRRRAELFMEAIETFVPTFAENIKNYVNNIKHTPSKTYEISA